MISAGDGALLIVGSFKRRMPDPDFKVSCTMTNTRPKETEERREETISRILAK
jgi:hypothetical protein